MTARAVLTDIEGTTTSLSFVRDVLFPYSRAHLRAWLSAHEGDADVAAWIASLGSPDPAATLEQYVDEDRKDPVLKAIQGRIWRDGFTRGELRAHVYADVPVALRAWQERGVRLAVFSSGSVEAQRLLFRDAGLEDLFEAYFDPTTAGAKTDPAAYASIARALGVDPSDGLFLSDAEGELDAAHAAGWRTTQVLREGVTPSSRHANARDFGDVAVLGG